MKVGSAVAPFLATILISVGAVILTYRKFIAPELMEQLSNAEKTITNLAKLAGVKSQEFTASRALGKEIAADVLGKAFPEAEALKLILSQSTWEKVEDAMEDNPEAILQLIDKYGPILGIGGEQQKTQDSDF